MSGSRPSPERLDGPRVDPVHRGPAALAGLLLSIAYALASYPFVVTLVITWANPLMIERTRIVEMTAGHAVFGIALGALYPSLVARPSQHEKVPPRRSRGGTV